MSSSITTYQGPLSAKERATQKWGAEHGARIEEQEQARHDTMMAAIRRLEKAEHADRIAREEPRDMHKWRKAYEDHLRKENAELERRIERMRKCRRQ